MQRPLNPTRKSFYLSISHSIGTFHLDLIHLNFSSLLYSLADKLFLSFFSIHSQALSGKKSMAKYKIVTEQS